MVIRIAKSNDEWFWILETSRGDSVCKSENWRDMDGGYTRKTTAITSAYRFMDNYLSDRRVVLKDVSGEEIGGINLF